MMKKIIIITAFLLGFTALNAQSYTLIAQRYEWLAGIFRALGLPAGDGPAAFQPGQRVRAGAVYYDSTGIDSGLYVYSGLAWKKQGEGGFFSPDQTSTGETTHNLNGQIFSLISDGESFLYIDPTPGAETVFYQAYNKTGLDNFAVLANTATNTSAQSVMEASFNVSKQAFVILNASAGVSLVDITADSLELDIHRTVPVSIADSALHWMMVMDRATGKVRPAHWPAGGGGPGGISEVIAGFGLLNINDSTLAVDTADADLKAWRDLARDTGNIVIKNPPGFAGDSIWQTSGDTLYLSTLIAGSNVTITRQVNGDLEISSTGGGGSTDTTSLSNRINAAYATMAAVNDSTFRLIRPNGTADTIQINSVGSGGSGSGGAGQLYQIILTSGTTWTTPSDITTSTRFKIKGVGAGGGGAGHNTTNGEGSGGGAGGAFEVVVTGLSPSTGYTYAIGAAGAAGDASPSAGGAGGNTTLTIGATTYTGNGGGGGATAQGAAGGVGGTATNGDINIKGQDGAGTGGTASTATGGVPGGSPGLGLGVGGGAVRNSAGSGLPGTGNGAGGGGGTGGAAPGGAGTQGVIIIEYIN